MPARAVDDLDIGDLITVALDQGRQEAMKRVAAELGIAPRVTWTGWRRDMAAVYNAVDLAVSSSLSEGFPNVVAEALACGVPCVVTDVGDCRSIVADDEWVVPPRDPDKLASAIGRALRSDRRERAEELRHRVVDFFSLHAMVDRTEQLLLEIVQS